MALCDFDRCLSAEKNLRRQIEALRELKKYIARHQMLINLTKEIEDLYCYVMLEQVFGSVTQTVFCGIQVLLVWYINFFFFLIIWIDLIVTSIFCFLVENKGESQSSSHVHGNRISNQ